MIERAFPCVKEIIIICPDDKFLHSYYYDAQDFEKHIARWCSQGRSVEVITSAERKTRRYMKDSPLEPIVLPRTDAQYAVESSKNRDGSKITFGLSHFQPAPR